jgi:hypothetical protein
LAIAILTVREIDDIDDEQGQLPTFNVEEIYTKTEQRMNNWLLPHVLEKIDFYITHLRTNANRNQEKRIKNCDEISAEPRRKRAALKLRKKHDPEERKKKKNEKQRIQAISTEEQTNQSSPFPPLIAVEGQQGTSPFSSGYRVTITEETRNLELTDM